MQGGSQFILIVSYYVVAVINRCLILAVATFSFLCEQNAHRFHTLTIVFVAHRQCNVHCTFTMSPMVQCMLSLTLALRPKGLCTYTIRTFRTTGLHTRGCIWLRGRGGFLTYGGFDRGFGQDTLVYMLFKMHMHDVYFCNTLFVNSWIAFKRVRFTVYLWLQQRQASMPKSSTARSWPFPTQRHTNFATTLFIYSTWPPGWESRGPYRRRNRQIPESVKTRGLDVTSY